MSESDWSGDDKETEADFMGIANAHLVRLISDPDYLSRCTRRRRGLPYKTSSTRQAASRKDEPVPISLHLPASRGAQKRIDGAVGSTRSPSGAQPPSVQRGTLRDVLKNALRLRTAAPSPRSEAQSRPLSPLVNKILICINKSDDRAYTAGAVIRGLTDPLNDALRCDVLGGAISPEQLVALDDESLLNPRMRAKCQSDRAQRREQQTVEFQQRLTSTVTSMFTCPSCGSKECYANFRSTDFVKWQGDDPTPTLLRCVKCKHAFKA